MPKSILAPSGSLFFFLVLMSDRGLLSHLLYGGSLVILCPFFDTIAPFCVALLSVRGLLSHLLCAGWVSCHTRCAPSLTPKHQVWLTRVETHFII